MSNDNKLKLLQYLYFFPAIVCMMLLVDMNTSPYAKLFVAITGSFAAIMLASFWNLKIRMKKEKSS
ncbi:hypothetical protein [Bacillus mobilis]|uniref:hypothetical protein n=1 Tax=Bacillus mobilis TaxID=2026190 RepID=UPI003CF2DB99